MVTEESSLDFIAPTQEVYDNWTDAINALLGKKLSDLTRLSWGYKALSNTQP